jgi:hypothetical protein
VQLEPGPERGLGFLVFLPFGVNSPVARLPSEAIKSIVCAGWGGESKQVPARLPGAARLRAPVLCRRLNRSMSPSSGEVLDAILDVFKS